MKLLPSRLRFQLDFCTSDIERKFLNFVRNACCLWWRYWLFSSVSPDFTGMSSNRLWMSSSLTLWSLVVVLYVPPGLTIKLLIFPTNCISYSNKQQLFRWETFVHCFFVMEANFILCEVRSFDSRYSLEMFLSRRKDNFCSAN